MYATSDVSASCELTIPEMISSLQRALEQFGPTLDSVSNRFLAANGKVDSCAVREVKSSINDVCYVRIELRAEKLSPAEELQLMNLGVDCIAEAGPFEV